MEVIADLQLHSRFSRAVSQEMVIPKISAWAARKGIGLVATGDWTHPLWASELKANLEEAADGLYRVKEENPDRAPLFLLSTEISSIYTQAGQQRRVHTLLFAPDFAVMEKISDGLRARGANLLSDGRPIVGLSAREVAEIALSASERCLVIPAHVWTPWFSLYGSNSGFDSIEECFGEFAESIYAIETGLSSDPAMNWRIEELDNRSIVSFSDAHSGPKLGREATVFEVEEGELSYESIRQAIAAGPVARHLHRAPPVNKLGAPAMEAHRRAPPAPHIAYTIEFYPEEGKYHYTGHRDCRVKQSPEETKELGTTCPVCGKKLTLGVMHRVEELASRGAIEPEVKVGEAGVNFYHHPQGGRPPFASLVPLHEILAEALEAGVGTQTVADEYNKLVSHFGGEFAVLLKAPLEELASVGGEKVAEGIRRVRSGKIAVDPGFDGVFGQVKIWAEVKKETEKQMSLF